MISISKSYQYGSYGFPTKETVTWDVGITTVTDQTYQHTVATNNYLLGSPLSKTVTQSRGGSSWVQSEVYGYTAGTLLPTSRTAKMQDKQVGKTQWTYVAGGIVSSEKSAPRTVSEMLGTSYVYDAKNRYLASETDALGRKTEYTNYGVHGQPTKAKNYLNKFTTYTYDTWGRASTVAYPDTTTETTTYAWETAAGLYSVTSAHTGKPSQKVYYDALGREVRTGVQCFDGAWRYTDKQYDSYGRLSKESLPFKAGSALAWNTYAYDAYDRIASLTEASGKVTTYSYTGKSATVTKDGIASTRTYDNSGLLVSASAQRAPLPTRIAPTGSCSAPWPLVE